jgi:hypothetical protein
MYAANKDKCAEEEIEPEKNNEEHKARREQESEAA